MVVCDVFVKYNIYNYTQANPGPKKKSGSHQ